MKNGVRELSILITWTLESFLESGFSMKSRGCGMRGRTAYSIYRFDNRDRSLVVVLFACCCPWDWNASASGGFRENGRLISFDGFSVRIVL